MSFLFFLPPPKTLDEGRRRQFACSKIINQIDQVTTSISIYMCMCICVFVLPFSSLFFLLLLLLFFLLLVLIYHLSIRVQLQNVYDECSPSFSCRLIIWTTERAAAAVVTAVSFSLSLLYFFCSFFFFSPLKNI